MRGDFLSRLQGRGERSLRAMQMVNPWRVGLLALAACLAAAVWALGWTAGFAWFGVPAMEPPFADLRTISGAVSSLAVGARPAA